MSMGLEGTLATLRATVTQLHEDVSRLRDTVTEDQPSTDAVKLVDDIETVVTDLIGALEEAQAHIVHALQVELPKGSLEQVRAMMRRIHELLNGFTATYIERLAAHTQIRQLLVMGRERGPRWLAWSREVKTAVERCAPPLTAAADAIVDCWSELAERTTRGAVSVQATNIGQQITV